MILCIYYEEKKIRVYLLYTRIRVMLCMYYEEKKYEFTYYIRWNFKKIVLQPDVMLDGFFPCNIVSSLGLFK